MTPEEEHMQSVHESGEAITDCWRCEAREYGLPAYIQPVDDRPAIDRYGTWEHEQWLIEMERREA